MFAIILMVSMVHPANAELRNGMWCAAPRALATDSSQTVRECVPVVKGEEKYGYRNPGWTPTSR